MQRSHFTKSITTTVIGLLVLLLGATVAVAQQQVNLIAGPTSVTLPDGSSVPMWGYTCGAVVSGSTATCAASNPAATGWSPVVITVPSGQALAINLTNNLKFTAPDSTVNAIPTSIVIVGQLGGGLGGAPVKVDSPAHENYSTSWPIAATGPVFVPPSQPQRVQSFATEVAGGTATTNALTWNALNPGTYLMESGTHPSIQVPMGLYGMVVVTSTPANGSAGTAYPNVPYNAEVPLLFSEIDPVQNNAVNKAVNTSGFSENATLGPYSAQPINSMVVVSGGHDYTSAPTVQVTGGGCVGSSCQANVTAVIDTDSTSPTYQQVIGFNIVSGGAYTSTPTVTISGGGCVATQLNPCASATAQEQATISTTCRSGGNNVAACYPPAVNYTPLYYLINGQAFDKTNAANSLFAVSQGSNTGAVAGNVLVRMVNAGSRMHVPSIVGAQTGTPAVSGFSLIAEDGNPLPGIPRVQSEVFMAAGKTYDVMINVPAGGNALPVYDRELSLSGNSTNRDAGMLAYIGINGSGLPIAAGTGAFSAAQANPDTYNAVVPGKTLTISDASKGVIANDVNVFGVQPGTTAPAHGTVTLNANGTFTYVPGDWSAVTTDSFNYCANGGTTACALVTLNKAAVDTAGVSCTAPSFTATNAAHLAVSTPGVLAFCKDSAGYPLTVDTNTVVATPSGSTLAVVPDAAGGFAATVPAAGVYTFTFQAQNSQGTHTGDITATLTFPAGSGLAVTVKDGADKSKIISDYRWIIEEDRTFYVDPKCTTNPPGPGCGAILANFGTNFHTSSMPVIANGCTGPKSCEAGQTQGGTTQVVCDVGNGACRPGTSQTIVTPDQVPLDPNKRYYISVLPGDSADPFNAGYAGTPDCSTKGVAAGMCGHGMGGAPIAKGQTSVTVYSEPSPYPPATLTVFVFEDDYPLNGEHDAGGGIDVLSPNEPGLGRFQITLFDDAGGTGDATGQPTYDMFNMPLTNSLAGTIDPVTGLDACPVSTVVTQNVQSGDASQKGIVSMIVTCPTYESDGITLSPLAGQAMVKNLYQGRYGVVATPAADRIAAGEEWLQTNTLDGQKAHDSFMRIGEPSYFQEFGPAGYHVTIGFANPKIINDRLTGMCAAKGADCTHEVKGHITTARMSRTPDERLYGSGTHDSYAFTQCYVSLGDPDGADFAFAKCADDGSFDITGVPPGNWKITTFDQWNDQVVDGITTAVPLCNTPTSSISGPCTSGGPAVLDLGEVAVHQWQANIYTRTFLDLNGNGVSDKNADGSDAEPGLALVNTNIRFRDGSFSNFNNTDLNGYAGFNEVFPLFNWYVIETDPTRYKNTGTHVVYDAGGPVDGSSPLINGAATPCYGQSLTGGSMRPCGNSVIAQNLANTFEPNPLPGNLHVPGAVYCNNADCTGQSIADGPNPTASPTSTGRIDPPWVLSEGWQGFSGQNNFLEFGKKPYAEATANTPAENGGIHGHVVYASTRPFDDPQLLLQLSWEPLVPHVKVNLYKEGVAPDGVTTTLTLVDTTQTSSFDDWAQGLRSDGIPWMNCPGQGTATSAVPDPYFWATIKDQPQWLDLYYNGSNAKPLPYDSQFKCYDGMHNWNQLQPAPYDGMYSFPSVTGLDPVTGKPTGSNCTACIKNPDATDPYRFGAPMLPSGKYVVEVVVPPGFELVKEEDKNILIGDNFIAPVTQQFAGLGNIFILPDQAAIGSTFNANNAQNSTNSLGRQSNLPSHEGDTGNVETYWPCVGEARVVPDYISLYPGSLEVAPFAGATRNLCDRKEVTLDDQTAAMAKFYIFTSTHVASHFTGVITDDFTAEFDPYSPQFGEKFAPAFLPVSFKDWNGNEVTRVYSDQWGAYNGLNYSTWEVNPPNPTGYGPTMMVGCMNDAGPVPDPNHAGQMMTDPLFKPGYSQFCYELPFMPGQTGYFDTPVVPTSAFAGGYNTPDCSYPDATPAVSEVDGDGMGPWVSATGAMKLTINALGDQPVDNYGYSGPSATTAPFNQQKVTRHYGFGTSAGTVTVAGVPLTNVAWGDTTITGNVQLSYTDASGHIVSVPPCAVQQQAIYGGSTAYCGELVITAANGKQSVDSVMVTIGGKQPTVMAAGQKIQNAVDTAQPGDMIIVPPGTYSEMLLMWKPVRLQGVGAASSVIDANPHPAGKLDPWRRQVVCLFGLGLNGREINNTNPYDPSNTFNCSGDMQFSVDREPLEATVGWDASLNGNLAEQLIEPTLMGAYEGAGITVLAKGVKFPTGTDPFASDVFPVGTQFLTTADCVDGTGKNPYPGNFQCNPSSIDGLTIQNSSQGGGGIYVHAWAHNLQISNNRVRSNQGTLSGGITIGQGEHPDANLVGGTVTDPGSCITPGRNVPANLALPFCFDMNVNVHNNFVVQNSSLGDELFSSTPAGAGGVTFCTGSDYYKFNFNWVCGNMSTGDAGGVAHVGFIYDGDIEHNSILFNQATNPTIVTNGGGLLIMGAPDVDPLCGLTTDQDCVPNPTDVTPSDGVGPGLVINANLILGNSADSGSGGGLRMQHVNGNEVINFPNGQRRTNWPTIPNGPAQPAFQMATPWNAVLVTNNIIANNVAGWDGGGVSLLDALDVNIVNNTIVSNDSTASSGVLFNSLFAPLASTQNTSTACPQPVSGENSCPQPAGLVSITNSAILTANLPKNVNCPQGHANCTQYSTPILDNNVITANRAFVIGVGGFGGGVTNQQKVVTLFNAFGDNTSYPFPGPAATSQTVTGDCSDPGASYWDIGVRGDSNPNNHTGGLLTPRYSFLTNGSTLYPGANNSSGSPALTQLYCDGSRVPPEAATAGFSGWQVPPGTNESNALPGPVFTLLPAATVDEGNNWINLAWGPLSLSNPKSGAALANFVQTPTSGVIDYIPSTATGPIGAYTLAPNTDFFGNPRKTDNAVDAGAIELAVVVPPPTLTSVTPNSGVQGTAVPVTLVGSNFTTGSTITVSGNGVGVGNIAFVDSSHLTATFIITPNAGIGARDVTVATAGGSATDTGAFSVLSSMPAVTGVSPVNGVRGTAVPVTITGTNFGGTTGVSAGNGVTVSNIAVNPTGTQITATFTISATAPVSTRDVRVTTPVGTSATNSSDKFSVLGPTVTSINPTSGTRGTTIAVSLTGTNLTGATAVSLGGGVTCTISGTPTATTVNASCVIGLGAAVSTRNVSVTTPIGVATLANAFTVIGPTLASVSPTSGTHGTTNLLLTFTGTNLSTVNGINGLGNGVTLVTGSISASSTTVTLHVNIAPTATVGNRNLSLRTSNMGSTNAVVFTVN